MQRFNTLKKKYECKTNMFVCEVCKKELSRASLYSHRICTDCNNTKLKSSYIYLLGSTSDMLAAEVCGNIIVVDNTPCVITNRNGCYEQINWEVLKEKAKVLSLSTYLWIKGINSSNWENYCFSFSPNDTQDIDCIRVFGFPNDSPYTNPVFDEVVIGRNDKKPYIRHSVANGMSPSHDPRLVSVSVETTFEDIRQVAKELNLDAYSDIDENNWIDRFETFHIKESNVYYMMPDESAISFVELLLKKNILINTIEIEPFFNQKNEIGVKMSTEQFINSFAVNWRMYQFKLQCLSANKSFIVYIDGLKKEVIANWPVDINQIIS